MAFTSAIDRFFKAPDALSNAYAYLHERRGDAIKLRAELTFKFDGTLMLHAEICGHDVHLHINGDIAGTGRISTSRGDCYGIKDVAQALAYILAVNW